MAVANPETYLKILPIVRQAPSGSVWLHYDTEADTLYVNFRKPSIAEDSELTDDDIIIRYDSNGEVIGYTILHAQAR
jgi:uncharacterized protein YuzE